MGEAPSSQAQAWAPGGQPATWRGRRAVGIGPDSQGGRHGDVLRHQVCSPCRGSPPPSCRMVAGPGHLRNFVSAPKLLLKFLSVPEWGCGWEGWGGWG